jgi:hypothetical protein
VTPSPLAEAHSRELQENVGWSDVHVDQTSGPARSTTRGPLSWMEMV